MAAFVPLSTAPTACSCAPGSGHWGIGRDGRLIQSPACVPCGQAPFAELPSSLDTQCVGSCPPDRPLAQTLSDGTHQCLATCPPGVVCSGVTCPSDRPFVLAGACVSDCPNLLVDFRECRDSCPAGQSPIQGVCAPPDKPPPPPSVCSASANGDAPQSCSCNPVSEGDTGCAASAVCFVNVRGPTCCRLRPASCSNDQECCSGRCSKADGFCLGRTGDVCTLPADCISGICAGTPQKRCGAGPAGALCAVAGDCRSNHCTSAFRCAGGPGEPCQTAEDCVDGLCRPDLFTCCGRPATQCLFDSQCCQGSCVLGSCSQIIE
jgi:hypothetical protein